MTRKVSVKRLIRLFAGMALAAVSCTQPIASTDTDPEAPSVPGVPSAVITVTENSDVRLQDTDLYQTTEGTEVFFSAALDGNLISYEYEWNFGYGTPAETSNGMNVSHSFPTNETDTYVVTLTVTDNKGISDTDTVEILINEPPSIAITSGNKTIELGTSITFETNGGDPDVNGYIATYVWDLGLGNDNPAPGSLVSGETIPDLTHTYEFGGTYVVTITVTDDRGTETISEPVTAVVYDDTQPTAEFTMDPPVSIGYVIGESIGFHSTSSDPNSRPLTYSWDFDDDTPYESVPELEHIFWEAGDYIVELRVMNDLFNQHWTTRLVSVNDPPAVAITGIPSGQWVNRGIPFTLGSTVTDSNDTSFTYEWEINGTLVPDDDSGSLTYTHNSSNDITATVTVTDPTGHSGTDSITLEVNEAPTVSFTSDATRINPGDSIQFTSTSDDPDGDDLDYEWDFNDGHTSTAENPIHSFADSGSYTVTVTVSDERGSEGNDFEIITVNAPPVADFTSPVYALEGESITFMNTSSDDAAGLSYAWDFGDSETSIAASPSHAYAAYGSYTVTLTVTDDDDLPDSATTTVEINALPTAAITGTPDGDTINKGESLTLLGNDSNDPGGSIANYAWTSSDGGSESGSALTDFTRTYNTSGDIEITLTVTDDDGETNMVDYTVTVVNQAPTAAFTPNTVQNIFVDDVVNFDAGDSSDPNGDSLTYNWNFGDGNTAADLTDAATSHTYTATGDYTVALTVSDGSLDNTLTLVDLISVTVTAP